MKKHIPIEVCEYIQRIINWYKIQKYREFGNRMFLNCLEVTKSFTIDYECRWWKCCELFIAHHHKPLVIRHKECHRGQSEEIWKSGNLFFPGSRIAVDKIKLTDSRSGIFAIAQLAKFLLQSPSITRWSIAMKKLRLAGWNKASFGSPRARDKSGLVQNWLGTFHVRIFPVIFCSCIPGILVLRLLLGHA